MKIWWKTFFQTYGKSSIFVGTLIGIVLFLYLIFIFIAPGKLRVSFLDIGQGDAILIQTPSGKELLIDGGPTDKIRTQLAHKLPYFDRTIDVVIATHPDADHVTGLIPVLENYKVNTILVSVAESNTGVFEDLTKHIEEEHADVHVAHTGDILDFHDGVTVRVLYPQANYVMKKNDTNDASISVVVTYGDETFLLTGDLPSIEEPKLISSGFLNKNTTVYKAGHHGSKTSSGEQLLTYIHPEYAVISAGKNNKYGHPNPETIGRLEKYAKEILSTIDKGTITFITDGKTIEVATEK